MIKVLLADDERLALEYLENIISWEYYGFQVIGAATDPEQALKMYKKYKPELVISDVRMPGMSGLELVNAIREHGGNSHILFLSAYKNFDYIKQAIRLDIDDYLLKSDLEEESFLKKILQLKEVIDKEKAKNQYTTGLIFEDLFKKNAAEENYKKILDQNEYIRIHKKYYYLILAQKIPPRFIEKYIPPKEEQVESFEYEFSNACNQYSEEFDIQITTVFPINNNEYLAILNINGDIVGQKEILDKIYYFSRKVFKGMNKEKEHQFDLYYCGMKMSPRQAGLFYSENKNQMSQRYLQKQTQIIEFIENKSGEKIETEPKSITSDEVHRMIQQRDKEEIARCIEIIKIAIQEEDFFSYLWYIKNMFEAISAFEGVLTETKSGRKFSLLENSASYDFKNPIELVDFIEFKLEEIQFFFREKEKKAYSSVVTNAINVIKTKYGDAELSSATVANDVNISASWLSTKFKEEVGIGVSDFINNIRVTQAKKMLEQGDYMIYEVSEKVGFTSSQYFSKIFKENVGLTPNQYRRKIMQNESRKE